MEEKKYIYSIVNYSKEISVSGPLHFATGMLGINNRVITLIPYRDIAAVVSNIHLLNFDKFSQKELAQLVGKHNEINTNLIKKNILIPMRFGMIAANTEEVRNILTKAYIQFKMSLERIAGKAEFVVQVFWNEKNVIEKLTAENSEIQKLKKETESKGKILGLPFKIKLGKRIFETIQVYRKQCVEDILANLTTRFPNFSSGKIFDFAKMGANGANSSQQQAVNGAAKEMIMNHSFLIGVNEESELESQLNQLADKYKDELKFKYIGPMPAYSFSCINLSMGNFDLVDKARRAFGLGESSALPEIKNAYYKLAAEHHPDKHEYKNDPHLLEETAKKMKDIIEANEILNVYCKHYLSAFTPKKEQVCSFKKEDVEDSIIVRET